MSDPSAEKPSPLSDLEGPLSDLLPAETGSPEATQALGGQVAEALSPPRVLALSGELGSGKTQFVKGFCAGLGVDPARVTSPTFTIINEYASEGGPVYHIDAYRLSGAAELEALGVEDYVFGEGYVLIEWADRIADLLPEDTIRLHFAHVGEERRRISPRPSNATE